jgi:ribulose-phosphate 3-epimerase
MGRTLIAPSILAADFAKLGEEVRAAEAAGADMIHVDVMDGHFVPNISIGPVVVKSIRPHTRLPLDVHLMISPVDPYIQEFRNAGADIITVHPEAGPHVHRTLQAVKASGAKAGLSLNPGTPVDALDYVIDLVDLVLIMSVNPGFGGQKFIQNTYDKLGRLNEMKARRNPNVLLEIDGGVTLENAPMLLAAGADVLVAGNTVFSSSNPTETIAKLVHEAAR